MARRVQEGDAAGGFSSGHLTGVRTDSLGDSPCLPSRHLAVPDVIQQGGLHAPLALEKILLPIMIMIITVTVIIVVTVTIIIGVRVMMMIIMMIRTNITITVIVSVRFESRVQVSPHDTNHQTTNKKTNKRWIGSSGSLPTENDSTGTQHTQRLKDW
jgi:hypothetical protein